MANYATLKAAVQAVVKSNGNKEITGTNMQSTLLGMITSLASGYLFKGVATPSTSPGTPDENVFYIGAAGTYTNFGTSTTVPVGSIGVFKYNGSWSNSTVKLFDGMDDSPVSASNNLAKSGGIQASLVGVYDAFKGNIGAISHSGNISTSLTSYLYTDYIYIKAGDSFKVCLFYGPSGVASCYVYDYRKTKLGEFVPSGYVSGSAYKTDLSADAIITQYPTAAYVRLSGKNVAKTHIDYPYIMYNTVNIDKELADFKTSIKTDNDFEKKGYVLNGELKNGVEKEANNAMRCIKFKPPTGKETHQFAIRIVPKDGQYADFFYIYDITASNQASFKVGAQTPLTGVYEKLLISDQRAGWEDALLYVDIDFTNLSAYYYADASDLRFRLVNCTADDIEFYARESIHDILGKLDLAQKESVTIIDGYYSNGASLTPNAEWRVAEYNIADTSKVYWASGSVRPAATRLVDYLNAQGGYISSECFGDGTLTYYTKYLLTVPLSAAKMRVTSYMNDEPMVFIGVPSSLDELNDKLENQMSHVNYWTGKTLWWCGTSIPAGSDATLGSGETVAGNYPTIVGSNLGATVINKAVGGSMCRANVRTGNYNGANFSNITSALSMTSEEVEDFITNYNTYKALPLNTSWPANLTDSDKARLRAASFEVRLLPYLDGTYPMPDLFVIDHGHNDFKYTVDGVSDITLEPIQANIDNNKLAVDTFMTANSNAKLASFMGDLSYIPSDKLSEFVTSLNRNCFIGAVNFIVTLILSHNPRARIVFISNYEYEHGTHPSYAPLILAQESISNSWAFPLCKVYNYLGFSNHYVPNSRSLWDTEYDLQVFNIYNPDTVHPHSDTSGTANKVYAGVIAEFIKMCR